MKKILSILILSAGLFSCSDLDVVPLSQLMEGNFPNTDGDAITLTNGIYQPNTGISTSLAYMIDLSTETTISGEEQSNDGGALLGVLQAAPTNTYVTSVWNAFFTGITRANDVIDKISVSKTVSETIKKRSVGEAHFMRAYYYFYAVQFWGEVPLVLHATEGLYATRVAIDDVYEQIVSDLEYAANNLPHVSEYSSTDKGRATKGAAYALLARVYLTWGQISETGGATAKKEKFRKSIDAANNVTGYVLEEEYLDNWVINNKNGKENIFSTQHATTQASDGTGGNHLAHCAFATGFSDRTPHVVVSDIKFYDAFDDRDQRKEGTYAKTLINPTNGNPFTFTLPRYRKYIDINNPSGSASARNIDRTILRYADVLLLKAESINEFNNGPTAEAYEAINTVRRRAFRHPLTAPSPDDLPSGLSYAGFKKAIQEERVFELTYEQTHWLDLVRWRIYVKTLKESGVDPFYKKQNVSLKHYRFPIPQGQRNINPEGLWQNYGYDGYDEAKTGANPYAGFE